MKWLLFLIPAIVLAQSDSKMLRSSNTIPDGRILISDQSYGPRYVRDSGISYSWFTNVSIAGSNAWLYLVNNSNNWNRINGAAFIASNQVFTGINGFSNAVDFYIGNWPSTNANAYRLFGYDSQVVSTTTNTLGTNVVLLLHGNGTNASTWFPDSSSNNCAIVANGDAHVTNNAQLGNGSVTLDGTGDFLSCTNTMQWDFGTGDWSVDFWCKPNGAQVAFAGLVTAIKTGPQSGWGVLMDAAGVKPGVFSTASGSGAWDLNTSNNLPSAVWTHIAFARIGNTLKVFTNGVLDGQKDVTGYTYGNTQTLMVGDLYNNSPGAQFNGNLDEIRVVSTVSAFTNAFTPPTYEYGTSSGTTNHTYYLYAIGPDGSTNQLAPTVAGTSSTVDTNAIVNVATNAAQTNTIAYLALQPTGTWNTASINGLSWVSWLTTNTVQAQLTTLNNQTNQYVFASNTVVNVSNQVVTIQGITNNFVITNDTRNVTLDGLTHGSNWWVSTAGNIGIGTNNPANTLDVNGKTTIRDALAMRGVGNTHGEIYFGDDAKRASTNKQMGVYWDDINHYWSLDDYWDGNHHIRVNNNYDIYLAETSGKVGIGTNAPATPLDVNGAATVRGSLLAQKAYIDPSATALGTVEIYSTNAAAVSKGGSISLGGAWNGLSLTQFGAIIGSKQNDVNGDYSGYLGFLVRSNGATSFERMRLDFNGNVGIGITNPATLLDVNGAATVRGNLDVATGEILVRGFGSTNTPNIAGRSATTTGIFWQDDGIGATLSFVANKFYGMYIHHNGYVGINTTNPATPLDVNGTATIRGILNVSSNIIPSLSNQFDLGSVNLPFRHLYVGTGSVIIGSQSMSVTTNGSLQYAGNTIATTQGSVIPSFTNTIGTLVTTNLGVNLQPGSGTTFRVSGGTVYEDHPFHHYFLAYMTNNQNFGAGYAEQIVSNTVVYVDTAGAYNSSTREYIFPQTGMWEIVHQSTLAYGTVGISEDSNAYVNFYTNSVLTANFKYLRYSASVHASGAGYVFGGTVTAYFNVVATNWGFKAAVASDRAGYITGNAGTLPVTTFVGARHISP